MVTKTKNKLETGDVIIIKKGMEAYTSIPTKFINANKLFSKSIALSFIIVGKTYYNDSNISYTVNDLSESIIHQFNCIGLKLSKKDAKKFVLSKIKKPQRETFIVPTGEYVITDIVENFSKDEYCICKKLKNGKFDKNGTEINILNSYKLKSIRKISIKNT